MCLHVYGLQNACKLKRLPKSSEGFGSELENSVTKLNQRSSWGELIQELLQLGLRVQFNEFLHSLL